MLPETSALADARLTLRLEGPVARLKLNAPAIRNAQTPTQWRALADIGANLPEHVRIVVIEGAGDCFSAGIDVRLLAPEGLGDSETIHALMYQDRNTIIDVIDEYQQGFTWLRDPKFLTIAKVHGYAIGAGFQLALACDLRVVADDAWFCMKEAALGLVPDLAGTKALVEIVGYSRALEICATARQVSADDAVRYGLVTALAAADDLEATTADLVAALLQNDAGVVREITALLASAQAHDLDAQRLAERAAQARRFRELAGMAGVPDRAQSPM